MIDTGSNGTFVDVACNVPLQTFRTSTQTTAKLTTTSIQDLQNAMHDLVQSPTPSPMAREMETTPPNDVFLEAFTVFPQTASPTTAETSAVDIGEVLTDTTQTEMVTEATEPEAPQTQSAELDNDSSEPGSDLGLIIAISNDSNDLNLNEKQNTGQSEDIVDSTDLKADNNISNGAFVILDNSVLTDNSNVLQSTNHIADSVGEQDGRQATISSTESTITSTRSTTKITTPQKLNKPGLYIEHSTCYQNILCYTFGNKCL